MRIDSCVNNTITILSLKDIWIIYIESGRFLPTSKETSQNQEDSACKTDPDKNAFEKLVEEEMIIEEGSIMVRPGKESIKMINLFHRCSDTY
ncbi:hypothetical protein CDAR_425431 [Caerostris darwini]|uniref:Uncharacterized protein n=1 Tax=Caerostris darwini TaxID=1538125 RepID=A0AAV4NYQ2_9ARAC|nr:hypothetical protein CDAR_425431 [Caerostris darwini]